MGGEDFGARLRRHRVAAGLSQRELAERVGLSVAAIRDLEQGRTRRPHRGSAQALAEVLGLPAGGPAGDAAAPVRIGVLGPLVVQRGGEAVPVGRGARRAVLGRLALSANAAVPLADLLELLHDGGRPAHAAGALHTHLSRLRSALRPGGRDGDPAIHRTPGGYRLDVAEDRLDLGAFRRDARSAATAPPERALELLERAARQWRGAPLEDVPQLRDHPLVTTVVDERVRVALRHAELALAAGQAHRCLPALRELAAAHPLHEPLHAWLIAALAAEGRQADALAVFGDIRQRLVAELGVDPGPGLTAAHRRVLRQEPAVVPHAAPPTAPPARPAPAQLPVDLQAFAGRGEAVAALDRLGSAAVIVVSGTAGVGKTTLAVHWGHRVRARFPDGQLYVNLRGFHPTGDAVTAAEALHGFLTALGLPPGRVPGGLEARAAQYRTLLSGRRMLVLLDNARDADQVRPLLPAAPGCVALVTSRHRLAGLVAAEGARPVLLDLLPADEARALLTRRLGAQRVRAEAAAVDAIVERCARLPLALAVAAARAATRPGLPLASLAAELAGRLDALRGDEPGTDVRAVLDCSYRQLTPAAARLLRLLGRHPGPDLGAAGAARLAGHGEAAVAPLLAELTGAHLLTEPEPGRFTMHDVLHAYAAERCAEEDSDDVRVAALGRLIEYYAHTASAAVATVLPGESEAAVATVLPGESEGAAAGLFEHVVAARAWLDRERANAVALAAHGRPAETITIAKTLQRYLDLGYYTEAQDLHARARAAARELGDPTAEATALNHLGVVYLRLGRFADAVELHREALDRFRAAGDAAGVGRSQELIGNAAWRLGDYESAREHQYAALETFRAAGHRLGEAIQLVHISIGNRQFGDLEAAAEGLDRALVLLRELGARHGEAYALDTLGLLRQETGAADRALECHEQAYAICAGIGYPAGQADALHHLARALLVLGRSGEAVGHDRRALALFREIGARAREIDALNGLGAALAAAGEPDAARDRYAEALALATETGERLQEAVAHEGLAGLRAAAGDRPGARRAWRHALTVYTDLGLPDAGRVSAALRLNPAP
ncbi:BTAD domain-containing putative transcriptional regulator [Dactylosporangium sp. CS-033363]|uniref:BTAD domain-containing putative transcriptional regulator n=1 Tax=Dactylosporangium sp. CS-033363 TaxID=3239935 RepID=UPI003D8B6E36